MKTPRSAAHQVLSHVPESVSRRFSVPLKISATVLNLPVNSKPEKGFTLIEVIVASIIFIMTAAGLLATISAISRPAAISERELTAATIARGVIERLRKDIDAESWSDSTGNLSIGSHTMTPLTVTGKTFARSYAVTTDASTGGRNISVTVTWDE